MIKKFFIVLLLALIAIQFFHPKRNETAAAQSNHIGNVFTIPQDVKQILEKACNDCHTNNTRYPWYSKIQPVDWWMDNHVQEGKKHLNLDDYTNRNLRYQYHKLEEIAEQVQEGEMPLDSYTWMHKDAKLTEAEKKTLIQWADTQREIMKSKYPIDSLVRKKN